MKFLVFKKKEDGSLETFPQYHYEAEFKQDTTKYRGHLDCPPHKEHFECPADVDADCAKLELQVDADGNEQLVVIEDADKKAAKTLAGRKAKLDKLRDMREPLLKKADHEVNKLEDNGLDTTAWRDWRKALRAVTDEWKKVDGDPKVAIDGLDLDAYQFPAEPA